MHLDRLITVLETIATAGRALTAADLHLATGLPRPTCYRLLHTLSEHGLLEVQDGSTRYLIGRRLMRIALLGRSDTDIRQAALPTLVDAAASFGEATFLSRFRNDGVEIIHVETPPDPARSYIHPGLGYRPMHACSCSKVIAAFADEAFQQQILNGPMKAYTEHTNTSRAALQREFAQIRSQGYAECVEEIETGVSSVAVPIGAGGISACFSIGTIGTVRRFNESVRAQLGEQLQRQARRVAAAIQLH